MGRRSEGRNNIAWSSTLTSSYLPVNVFYFAASLNAKSVFLCIILLKNSNLQFLAVFALDKRIGSKPSWLLMNL